MTKKYCPAFEYLQDWNPEAMYPTNMRDAIIGVVVAFGRSPQFLLDRTKCIKILMKDGMSQEDAEEFFEYNVIGSGGSNMPSFAILNKDLNFDGGSRCRKTTKTRKR